MYIYKKKNKYILLYFIYTYTIAVENRVQQLYRPTCDRRPTPSTQHFDQTYRGLCVYYILHVVFVGISSWPHTRYYIICRPYKCVPPSVYIRILCIYILYMYIIYNTTSGGGTGINLHACVCVRRNTIII